MLIKQSNEARRVRAPAAATHMEDTEMETSQTMTEAELAKVLQAHFRRFVHSARLTQDRVTGEPVVQVQFDRPAKGASAPKRVGAH